MSLHGLERKGFVRRERDTSTEGDTEYAFLHVLVREVTYAQIPRVPRAEKHRLAAEWIASLGRPEDHAELLAHHYGESLVLARAAGVETAALEEHARHALRNAGDRATALNAHPAALRFYERALELWPEDDDERPRLAIRLARAAFLARDEARSELLEEARDALLARGDRETAAEAEVLLALALRLVGRLSDARDHTRRAAALLEHSAATPAKVQVLAEVGRLAVFAEGRYDEGIDVAREALQLAEELGLAAIKASALHTIGFARVQADDFDGLADLEESLRIGLEHSSPYDLGRFYNNLGFVYLFAGQVERALEMHAGQLEHCERFGQSTRWPRAIAVYDSYWFGSWEEASRSAEEFLAEQGSSFALEPDVLATRARMRLARDDVVGAADDCDRALELTGGDWEVEPPFYAAVVGAQVALAQGRRADALALVERMIAASGKPLTIRGTEVTEFALLLRDLDLPRDAIVEEAESRPAAPWLQVAASVARDELERAADGLAALRTPPLEAAVRLCAAKNLVAEGRRAEADVQLQKALAFYRSVGATRYIREGEALLAAAS